jgi:glycerophosphoryl diester phosphodiesterase
MRVFGHRGASAYAPENTMAAFELALKQGAHGIELDVQRTADGEVVVIHDFTLDRTSNGSGPVADKTFAELRSLDFGGWSGADFAGEKIPTLDEVLSFLSGNKLLLNIEVKSIPSRYDAGLTKAVAEKISQSGLASRIIVSSFDHRALVEIKDLLPGVKTGILYSCGMWRVWDYAATVGAGYIHPLHHSIMAEDIAGCHANNIGVNAWTADTQADITRLLEISADSVITNGPDLAVGIIAR